MATTKVELSRPPEHFVMEAQSRSAMTEALSSKAAQEVQAALVIAKRFPRDEFMAVEKIKTACRRKELAESAEYEYSRGGTKICGPSVDLLRAIAKRWGNIDYGWQEVERKNGESQIRAFAWDMETNTRAEMSFAVRHWRDTKEGGYALKDERDIYELTANMAARRERACLEKVIDSDIVQMAQDECRKTLNGQSKEPLTDRARKMVDAFSSDFGITVAMLEKRIGNKLEAISENQLASLRRVYKSLKDGVGVRDDFFKPDKVAMGMEAEPQTEDDALEKAGFKPAPPDAKEPLHTVQQSLGELITQEGFTYDQFAIWGESSGNLPDAKSLCGFADVPTDVCKRLLRSSAGLIKGLKEGA